MGTLKLQSMGMQGVGLLFAFCMLASISSQGVETMGMKINAADEFKRTAVMIAVLERRMDRLEILLKEKPDLSLRDLENHNVLDLAMEEPLLEIVEQLLQAGANVNAPNPETGSTVLMQAVRSQNLELINILKRWGANPELVNKNGESAIDLAKKKKASRVLQILESTKAPTEASSHSNERI